MRLNAIYNLYKIITVKNPTWKRFSLNKGDLALQFHYLTIWLIFVFKLHFSSIYCMQLFRISFMFKFDFDTDLLLKSELVLSLYDIG